MESSSGFPGLAELGFHSMSDGTKIYYEVHGTGPQKLVLIEGFHTSCLTWEQQVTYLVQECPNEFQVLILDNRGYGKSDRPMELYTTTLLASDVYSILQHLKWPQYHIIGQSMGGMIATELALLDLQKVASLILVVTHTGGFGSTPPVEATVKLWRATTSLGIKERSKAVVPLQYPAKWLDSNYEGTLVTNRSFKELLIQRDIRWGLQPDTMFTFGLIGQISAITRHYVSNSRLQLLKDTLATQQSPILVIGVEEDLLVRVQNSAKIAEALDCPIVYVQGAGHMVHDQCPAAFNRLITDHMRSASIGKEQSMSGGDLPRAKL